MLKAIWNFFDKTEDKVRGWFSRRPLLYAFVGGVGIVLFWRGVWHTVDQIMDSLYPTVYVEGSMHTGGWPWWDGPLSLLVGSCILLIIGVFVSEFIGNEIIISGIKGEKKLVDMTEREVKSELKALESIVKETKEISEELERVEKPKRVRKKPVSK
jgi:hypothetical protein